MGSLSRFPCFLMRINYMSLPISSFNAVDSSANKLRHTYVKGFVDISGGDLNLQNGAFHMYRGSNSVYFGISGDHFTATSYPSSQRVDVSLSSLIFLNSISGNVDDSFATINQRISGVTYDLTFDRTVIDNSISANGIALFNSDVSINGNLLVYGNSSFTKYPVFTGVGDPTNANEFVTKTYVDINGGAILLGSNNTWRGNNYFSNYLPAWSGTGNSFPVYGNQFTVKSYVDDAIQNGGGTVLLSANNTWSGNNYFSNYLPVWSGTGNSFPVYGNQFTVKSYVDDAIQNGGGTVLLTANNTWSGNNNFSNYLPTWTGNGGPVQGNQFATKDYVDTNGSTLLLSSNNLFSGNNTFGGDVSMNKTLVVSGDVSFNGNLRIGGAIFQQVPALGFDGGFPGTDFSITPKLDAGFYT
jgi:hypothetical protein